MSLLFNCQKKSEAGFRAKSISWFMKVFCAQPLLKPKTPVMQSWRSVYSIELEVPWFLNHLQWKPLQDSPKRDKRGRWNKWLCWQTLLFLHLFMVRLATLCYPTIVQCALRMCCMSSKLFVNIDEESLSGFKVGLFRLIWLRYSICIQLLYCGWSCTYN